MQNVAPECVVDCKGVCILSLLVGEGHVCARLYQRLSGNCAPEHRGGHECGAAAVVNVVDAGTS